MLIFYAKYAFLFWFFVGTNQGEMLLMQQVSHDKTLLNVTACTQNCLEMGNQDFRGCYNDCKANGTAPGPLRKVQDNFQLHMLCRTESQIVFHIDWVQHSRGNDTAPNATFIIKVAKEKITETRLYLSDENFLILSHLASNSSHNITALAVHGDGSYSLIAREQSFVTLQRGYQPSKMGAVSLRGFVPQANETHRIAAEIEWQPSAERNCYFDMVSYSTNSVNMDEPRQVEFRDLRKLYRHTVDNMEFDKTYLVGVRTVNILNRLESEVEWLTVEAPSCLDWYPFNYTLCPPHKPDNLTVLQEQYERDTLALNISWTRPSQLPDNYTLRIFDLFLGSKEVNFTLDKSRNHFFIPRIKVMGSHFEVHLVAETPGGKSFSALTLAKAPRDAWLSEGNLVKLILFIIVPICCILMLCSLTFCRRNRSDCQALEMEAKEAKASDFHLSLMDSSLLVTLSANESMDFTDELEVEPRSVLLQDVLGEGAFGLVRRGVYKKRQVAVKLLKDEPNDEDVYAFKCEIQMLKAVGKHPNIVGIVGYSTRCSSRMMLLIEYCSLGSLQNFLRDEWKFRQESCVVGLKHNLEQNVDKRRLPRPRGNSIHNRIEDMNSSMLSTVEEESEADQTHNSSRVETYTLTRITNAKDNKGYGLEDIENIGSNHSQKVEEASRKESKLEKFPETKEETKKESKEEIKVDSKLESKSLTFENKEYFDSLNSAETKPRVPLKYADLLDIAQQVAVGMEFLAQNKVVHRDLAARNVLISLDRSIKIADFGLSRDVYHENVYRKSGGSGKLPIKWLALESLTHQVYTSQSDVWSFGVLLYEITTLGGMPYPSVSPSDLLQLLRQGHRMKRPEGCTNEMFALMESCWCSVPSHRPTFTGLKEKLGAMISATNDMPERLKQLQAKLDSCDILSNKAEQLSCEEEPYLEPLQ